MRQAILFATVALALAAGPVAAQGTYGFGTVVGRGDYDHTPLAVALTASPCALDTDGDGAYDAGEPLLLDTSSAACASHSAVNDVRLTTEGDLKAGSWVRTSDPDFDRPLVGPVNDDLRYYDADGDAEFGSRDTLYLDIVNAGSAVVDVGDLRFTRFGDLAGGAAVKAGDADVRTGLRELRATPVDLLDANVLYVTGGSASPYKTSRVVYINTDAGALGTADLAVEPNDVRLTGQFANPFAGAAGKPDVQVRNLAPPGGPVPAGQAFQVGIEVENVGKAPGSGLVATTLGGAVVDARGTPALDPAGRATLVLTLVAPAKAGTVALEAGGQRVQLMVAEALQATEAVPSPDFAGRAARLELRLNDLESEVVVAKRQLADVLRDEAPAVAAQSADLGRAEPGAGTRATPGAAWPLLLAGLAAATLAARRPR